jgi:hypothetical protein
MKTKLITIICAAAILSMGANTASAAAGDDDLKVAADTLVVRPVCLAATVIGTGLFVISLPIAAISHSVKKTAHVLVVRPARATFTRRLGDMEDLEDY